MEEGEKDMFGDHVIKLKKVRRELLMELEKKSRRLPNMMLNRSR